MLINPAVPGSHSVGQKGFKFFIEELVDSQAQQFVRIRLAPFTDASCHLRSSQQLFEIADDSRHQFQNGGIRTGGLVCIGSEFHGPDPEIRLACPQPVQVSPGKPQGLFAHRMMRTPANLVGDRAATHMNLGKVDGVLPHLVNQFGPGDQP